MSNKSNDRPASNKSNIEQAAIITTTTARAISNKSNIEQEQYQTRTPTTHLLFHSSSGAENRDHPSLGREKASLEMDDGLSGAQEVGQQSVEPMASPQAKQKGKRARPPPSKQCMVPSCIQTQATGSRFCKEHKRYWEMAQHQKRRASAKHQEASDRLMKDDTATGSFV